MSEIKQENIHAQLWLEDLDTHVPMSKREIAVLLNKLLDPFNKPISIYGHHNKAK